MSSRHFPKQSLRDSLSRMGIDLDEEGSSEETPVVVKRGNVFGRLNRPTPEAVVDDDDESSDEEEIVFVAPAKPAKRARQPRRRAKKPKKDVPASSRDATRRKWWEPSANGLNYRMELELEADGPYHPRLPDMPLSGKYKLSWGPAANLDCYRVVDGLFTMTPEAEQVAELADELYVAHNFQEIAALLAQAPLNPHALWAIATVQLGQDQPQEALALITQAGYVLEHSLGTHLGLRAPVSLSSDPVNAIFGRVFGLFLVLLAKWGAYRSAQTLAIRLLGLDPSDRSLALLMMDHLIIETKRFKSLTDLHLNFAPQRLSHDSRFVSLMQFPNLALASFVDDSVLLDVPVYFGVEPEESLRGRLGHAMSFLLSYPEIVLLLGLLDERFVCLSEEAVKVPEIERGLRFKSIKSMNTNLLFLFALFLERHASDFVDELCGVFVEAIGQLHDMDADVRARLSTQCSSLRESCFRRRDNKNHHLDYDRFPLMHFMGGVMRPRYESPIALVVHYRKLANNALCESQSTLVLLLRSFLPSFEAPDPTVS